MSATRSPAPGCSATAMRWRDPPTRQLAGQSSRRCPIRSVPPGSANPAEDVGDPVTGAWLLGHGYALAGSSYATTGWAIQQALPDQISTLDLFDQTFGTPAQTIAWGHSLGGIITAGLIQQYPDRLDR